MKKEELQVKKIISVLLSLLLSLSVFAVGSTGFAMQLSSAAGEPIVQIELNEDNTTVTLSFESAVYSGSELKPTVSVSYTDGEASLELAENTDYRLEYADNTLPGKATVKVKGMNSYCGEIVKSFIILPKKMTGLKKSKVTYKSITVAFTSHAGVSGYQLMAKKSSAEKFKSYNVPSDKKSYTIGSLSPNTKYDIKLRAYTLIDGVKKYGAYSKVVSIKTNAVLKTPVLKGYCTLDGVPTITWAKIRKAQKYVVYRSTKKKGTYKKVATIKKRSYADKKTKLHKNYYYKVRACRTISGKKYYSAYSKVKRVKAMKTVFVGDSVMEGVKLYKAYPKGIYITKVGMGPYTYYNSNYFTAGGSSVTGVEKTISLKPDRIFMMLGMNEIGYKSNSATLEYYGYSIEDIKDELKGVEIIILAAPPSKQNSGKSIPKKPRIDSYNTELKKFAKNNGCKYYDYTAPFKDSNGYLLDSCDGGDGMHWNPTSSKLFISQINKYIKK
jgi:lysophospholipase L1-like esterase